MIGWAVVAGTGWVVGYLVACRIWPFVNCRRCRGAGRFRSPWGRAWRLCRKCKGSGSRVRTGRRLWDRIVVAKGKAVG